LSQGAAHIASFEKNPDVIWLRGLNPWSPPPQERLALTQGDILRHIEQMPAACHDAALHDPPRFGIAGDLYSRSFYDQLFRVLKPRARLFHYTGSPNKLTSKRDVPSEVLGRLEHAGFMARINGDGILAFKP
jgi:predicted methyltransferase